MALKPPDDQFTDKDLRQMQYNRCSADWAALDSDMWQIPTLLIAVNTLILAVAFEYIKNNLPIRTILLLFATVWSIFLILGFLRIHATQLHRSAFMLEIEKKATDDAHLSTPLLEVETHKMLKWLQDWMLKWLQDWHPADEPKPRTPGKPERWLIENAGKSAGLVLGAIIVLADLLLFAWTVRYLLVVPQL